MSKPLPHLTASDFYKWLKCPNWVYWDLFGDPKEKGEVSQMIERLREEGVLHEKAVIEKLGAFEEVLFEGTLEEQAAKTLSLMKKGTPLIYQGVLMRDDWVGRPDLLARGDDGMYMPVDIKSSYEIRDAHKLQLVFYAHLLEHAQGVKPERGAIMNVDGKQLEFPIGSAEPEFFTALAAILKIRAGEKPDPFFTSSCKESPWLESCRKEAETLGDPSLIYKLYKSEWKRLREAGYDTVKRIADAKPEHLHEMVRGVSDHRLDRIRLQAKALVNKQIIRIGEAELPEAGAELFFDIEGDPLIGVEYLFGLLVRDSKGVRYEQFLAEKPEDEGKAWLAFCDFMEGHVGEPIYHYGFYETAVIRRLSAKYGISDLAAAALDPGAMIDLVRVVQRTAIFPLRFYSLKDVCKYLGFKWRASDASGANSVLWFQDWLEKGDRAMMQKIIDYNEDDVRATLFLKDWLVISR